MVRALIADGQPVFALGLEALFQPEHDVTVVGRCSLHDDVLPLIRDRRPNLLLLDLDIPAAGGLAVVQEIARAEVSLPMVLTASAIGRSDTLEAIRAGVRGIVLRNLEPHLYLRCIRKVCNGGTWLETDSMRAAMDHLLRQEAAHGRLAKILTARELEVMRLAVRGSDIAEVAKALNVAPGTVKTHLHNIYAKLNLTGRLDLMRYATEFDYI